MNEPKNKNNNPPPLEVSFIINFDKLEKNSVICFRIKEMSEITLAAIYEIQKRYEKILRDKNITLMILGIDDKIEEISEQRMNSCDWHKKEPSKIITLDRL